MNMQTIQSVLPRALADPAEGWRMARMRFWDKPFPNVDDTLLRNPVVRAGTGWLDNAEVALVGEREPEDKPVEVQWMTDVDPMPATLSGRLGEMAAAYDWELPARLTEPVANARAALKEQHLSAQQEDRMVRNQWPEVWRELRLYENRRLLAEAEVGNWNYEAPEPWSHSRWEAANQAAEDLARQMDRVNARSYVHDDDSFLHQRAIPQLNSFLPEERGYAAFHIGG